MKTFEHLAKNPFAILTVVLILFFVQRIWSLTRPRLCFTEFGSGDVPYPGRSPRPCSER